MKKEMTTQQREIGLKELIQDAEELDFSYLLITDYKTQLKAVQVVIKKEKQKMKMRNHTQ